MKHCCPHGAYSLMSLRRQKIVEWVNIYRTLHGDKYFREQENKTGNSRGEERGCGSGWLQRVFGEGYPCWEREVSVRTKEASVPALQMGDKLPVPEVLQRCQCTVWVTGGGGRCNNVRSHGPLSGSWAQRLWKLLSRGSAIWFVFYQDYQTKTAF